MRSTFIAPGCIHRLSNPGHVDLHMIEVQSGEYVGEDDIVRLADDYGREGARWSHPFVRPSKARLRAKPP